MKNVTKYTSDGQTLTITAQQGKKGFNVKASMKVGSGKGAEKALTGCRETFKTEAEALSTAKKLGQEATKRGWVEATITKKNSFTSIPEPVAKKGKKAA